MNLVDMKNSHVAGVVELMSGVMFDLQNPQMEDIRFDDIAWSLARQLRYNGHSPFAYTVARHSILMSHVVPPEFAMEALLHDAGEAYLSDVVNPLKKMLPIIEELEDKITAMVMRKFYTCHGDSYTKSEIVDEVDYQAYQYECYIFARSNGVFYQSFNDAELLAFQQNGLGNLMTDSFPTDYAAFNSRFMQLSADLPIAATG